MAIRRVHLFYCPNEKCRDHIVLPRQSHLGKFDDQQDQATDIWPIRYLCLYCGLPSEVPANMIRLEVAETQDQYQLVRYDFSTDQSGSIESFAIYTKERICSGEDRHIFRESRREAFERVLKPFGLLEDSYGDKVNVSVDPGLCYQPPMRAEKESK